MELDLTVCKEDEKIVEAILNTMFNTESKGYILAVQTEKGNFIELNSKGSEALRERIVKNYLSELEMEHGEDFVDDIIREWREDFYE